MQNIDFKALGLAAAVLFGAYKFGTPTIRAGAVAVAAVIVAKQVPYVNQVI